MVVVVVLLLLLEKERGEGGKGLVGIRLLGSGAIWAERVWFLMLILLLLPLLVMVLMLPSLLSPGDDSETAREARGLGYVQAEDAFRTTQLEHGGPRSSQSPGSSLGIEFFSRYADCWAFSQQVKQQAVCSSTEKVRLFFLSLSLAYLDVSPFARKTSIG